MCSICRKWRKNSLFIFILALSWIVRSTVLPTDVRAGGIQTLEEVNVTDSAEDLVGSANSATEGTVTKEQIESRPIMRVGELLESVPGLVVTQHSGEGKANQYFMRGFNLDHGTDFSQTVDGMPVNMRTHAHGQGYSDINFVIPELITGLQYKKGISYADEGDFSSAGAVNMNYATSLDQGIAQITYGSFSYRRAVTAASTKVGPGTLLYGVEGFLNDGPWDNPDAYAKFNGVLRYTVGDAKDHWSLTAMGYDGRWNSTDQIPQALMNIDRFGAVDPTDGGESHRYSVSTEYEKNTGSAITKTNLYVINYKLDLFSDFLYSLRCDPANSDVAPNQVTALNNFISSKYRTAVPCSQMHQRDDRTIYGGNAVQTWIGKPFGLDMDNTLGVQARYDDISPVGLYYTVARQTWFNVSETKVKEGSVGLYYQNGTRWADKFRTVAGVRGDFYSYNVAARCDAALGPAGCGAANSGTASSSMMSPKLTLIFGPWAKTELYINGGLGFHSNDARGTTITVDPVSGNPATQVTPLVRTKGAEVGIRSAYVPHWQMELNAWILDMDSELVFSGDGGSTSPSFATRRKGVEFANYYTPTKWLTVDADIAYTDSKYTTDPNGDRIENSIPLVIAAGITVDHLDGPFGSIRVRHFSEGPLVDDNSVTAPSSTLVNLQAGYELSKQLKVVGDIFNLLDAQANDIAYAYDYEYNGTFTHNGLSVHPAEPRQFRVSMVYKF